MRMEGVIINAHESHCVGDEWRVVSGFSFEEARMLFEIIDKDNITS